MVPPHMGRLTESGNSSMILRSARRGVSSVEPLITAPPTPRARKHTESPLRLQTPSRARARITAAMPRRARDAPAGRASQREKRTGNDDSHHDQRGRRSVRGDAPHAPPQPYRDPTLLQHQRLHQLPRRRSDDRGGNLPDLRIHEADALDRIVRTGEASAMRVCSRSVPSDRRVPCFQPIFAPRAHATCRDRRWPQDARLARPTCRIRRKTAKMWPNPTESDGRPTERVARARRA